MISYFLGMNHSALFCTSGVLFALVFYHYQNIVEHFKVVFIKEIVSVSQKLKALITVEPL